MEQGDKNAPARLPGVAVDREALIISSWQKNARPWISAVRQGQISSRVEVTDRAVLNAIRDQSPGTVLDVGCGEGWLSRTLAAGGVEVLGVDAVEELLDSARQAGAGSYRRIDYQELSFDTLLQRFDMIVCNFSLFGKDSVEQIFAQAPRLLNRHGMLLVQTLHPLHAGTAAPDPEGWREGSWQGFGREFSDPAPWFCRSMDAWRKLFTEHGFAISLCEEPMGKNDNHPVSLLMMGRKI